MGFEIQIAVYRNYNSGADKILETSPFSSKAIDLINFLQGIKHEGGDRNEAIEVLYHNVLNVETGVSQLIVIGDANGNTYE